MTEPASRITPRTLPFWQQMRWRLVIFFVVVALLPAGFLFGIMDQQTTRQYTDQTIAQLESIAEIKSDQIVRYLEEGDTAMEVLVSDPARHDLFVEMLTSEAPDPDTQRQVFILLREMVNAQNTLKDLTLYRPDGTIVAASVDHWIGTNVSNKPYFQRSLEVIEDYVEAPFYNHAEAEFEMIITHRLLDESGSTAGIISAELNIDQLGLIMTERTGLGATGETYLVSQDESLLLTPLLDDDTMRVGRPIHTAALERALAGVDNRGLSTNYASTAVIGVYRWLPEIEAALVAEVSEAEAFAAREAAREGSNRFAALIALLAGVAGLVAATFISSPVQEMTDVASDIAGGNLSRRVKIQRQGEIGLLGEAFNSMADQLQSMVSTLETRVQDRTRALELAAEVAREVSAALNLEQLLNRVVELTKVRFNLYHTHVYLLDDEKQSLVMEAGAGEAGRMMKEAGHSIPLSAERSLVARAARSGQPVIVNDVSAQPDHLPNPLLPDTRSEMAVPMRLAEQVIGVLDVQADQVDRFTETDSQVLTTLADQVAVAVQNARLYQRTGQSELLLRSVIDTSQDWIWAKDRNFNFVLVNKALAEQGFGLTVDEVVGKNDYDIFPPELIEGDPARGIKGFRADDTAALNGSVISIPHDVVRHVDGSEHILDTQKSPLYDAAGNIVGTLGIGRDISVQYNARRRQQTAYEMGERLTRLLDPESLLQEAVDRVAETFEYYHTHVYLLDPASDRLVVRAGLGEAGEVMKAVGHSIALNAERSLVARAARERQPVVVNDVNEQPDHLPNPLLPETRSEIAVPLISGDAVIGVLDVQQNQISHFDEDEVRTLQIIATQLAIGLSNAQLYEEAQTALAETANLYAASDQIGRATSLDDVLQALVGSSVLGEFDRVNIGLFDRAWADERPQTLTIVSVWERGGEASRAPERTVYPVDRMPVIGLMGRSAPLIVEDVAGDERVDAFTREVFAQLGMNAVMGLPLTVGDQWIGVVAAPSAATLAVDDKQVRFVEAMIDQAAAVTQNLRLYQEIQNALNDSRATQRLLRSVIDTTPDWIWVKDRQGRFVTMNISMATAFGAKHEDILGKTDADLGVPAQTIEQGLNDDRAVLQGKALTIPTEVVRHPDGTETILETRKLPLYDAEGNAIAVLGIATDITERRRTQQRERLAYELGQDLAVLFNPDLLLRQTIGHLSEALGYYHAHVYRAEPKQGLLVVAEGLGEAGEILKQMGHSIPMNAERSLVALAARTLDPVVVNDVTASPDHLPNPLLPDTKSEAAIPLYSGQRLLGVLDVQHNVLNAFTDPEVRTLRVVANQLAIALSNAELYQEQLQNAERLRELDRLKSEFLANMSHELRTPLNSIIGYSELLIDEVGPTLDEMSAEDLKAIHSSGQHLLAIINDILDLAKIEAGRLELNRTPLTLPSIAMPLADSARVLLKDKPDVELQINLSDDLPEVQADTVRLRQILWNLLSNAIKFTEQGSICLSGAVEGGEMVIAVQDTGAGIDPHYHHIVFDQFRQADGSATRKAGGTGLGLAITRQLVELHGGRIWLDSQPGEGSTFTFTLPLAAVESSQPAEPAAATGD